MTAQISEHITAECLKSGTVMLTNHGSFTKSVSIVLAKDEAEKLRIALEAFERKAMGMSAQSQTPETDNIRLTIAAGDWIKESDATKFALSHADSLETRLNEALAKNKELHGINADSLLRMAAGVEPLHFLQQDYIKLKQERTSLLAQIAVKDEALNWYVNKSCLTTGEKVIGHNALTNSPAAAREMIERMAKLENALRFYQGVSAFNAPAGKGVPDKWSEAFDKATDALSSTKKPEGGV